MKNKISIIFSSILFLIVIMLFCPLTSKCNLAIHAYASNNENLYVTSKNRQFTKSVLKGDTFRINIIEKKKVNPKDLKFSSKNKNIATVDAQGNITALDYGTSKITVKKKKGNHIVCTFTVTVVKSIPRTLFIGDSRSVYMFNKSNIELCGVIKNGMYVYARAGAQFWYINEVVGKVDPDSYDSVVTWMGANDRGSFTNYKYCYNEIKSMGKKIVLCTVGPVRDALLDEIGIIVFNNGLMKKYNKELKKWSKKNNIPIIDLYSYIVKKKLKVDSRDGVHYLPRPTTKIWKRILSQYAKLS